MCQISDIVSQPKIDWLAHDPQLRAWVYIEKYRRYWLRECYKRTHDWGKAEDLFGDAIVLNSPKYSARYDEVYGLAFTTYMSRNLMWEISRDHVQEKRRKGGQVKIISETDLQGRNECLKQTFYDKMVVEDLSDDLNDLLRSLEAHNPQAYEVFVDHVLHEIPISTLSLKYRISRWLIGELLKDAKKHLCRIT